MGTTHFLLRRFRNDRTVMASKRLACNMRQMIALAGVRGLMKTILS
ncbi:hypothetical protein [Cribrihabitans pelagius]